MEFESSEREWPSRWLLVQEELLEPKGPEILIALAVFLLHIARAGVVRIIAISSMLKIASTLGLVVEGLEFGVYNRLCSSFLILHLNFLNRQFQRPQPKTPKTQIPKP